MTATRLPQTLDPSARQHVRAWVRTGTLLVAGGYLLSLTVNLGLASADLWTLSEVGAAAAAVVAFALASRDKVGTAAMVTIVAVWAEVHVAPFSSGEVMSSGISVLPVLVVAAGLFFGGPVAIGLAAVTVVSYPAAAAIGAGVLERGAGIGVESVQRVTVLAVTLLSAGVLVHIGRRSFSEVLLVALTNERKFSLLVSRAPDGIVLLDAAGRVKSMNPAAERLLNTTESVARGRRFNDVLARLTLGIHVALPSPDDPPVGPVALVLAHGADHRVAVEMLTGETVLPDGSAGLQIMLRDVTDRHEVERHATQLGQLIDASPSEVYAFDVESLHLRLLNRGARLNLGYDDALPENLTVTTISPALTAQRARRLITELSGHPHKVLYQRAIHRRRDGSTYPVELRIQLASSVDEPTLVVFALAISDQIVAEQERGRLQTQLLQAQKMEGMGQLAGAVAHDFNNLLMAVGGYADMILEHAEDERIRQWAQRIRRAQEQGAMLTRRLRGFAHEDHARPERFALANLLSELRPTLLDALGDRATLSIESSGSDHVVIDRTRLELILVNLLTNARTAMPNGGTVHIAVRGPERDAAAERDRVIVEVRDTGVGMDSETRRRAFDPFFTTKPRDRGTGLGLTTVQAAVAQAGGTVELESSPGSGTIVRVSLPAAGGPDADAPYPAGQDTAIEAAARILLVEDDDATREVVEAMLARAGHVMVTAQSAEGALDYLDSVGGEIDLLLSDVVLPERSGFDLARDVRERYPDIRILHMSGYLDRLPLPDDRGFDSGVDMLFKPFTATELLERVATELRRRTAEGRQAGTDRMEG